MKICQKLELQLHWNTLRQKKKTRRDDNYDGGVLRGRETFATLLQLNKNERISDVNLMPYLGMNDECWAAAAIFLNRAAECSCFDFFLFIYFIFLHARLCNCHLWRFKHETMMEIFVFIIPSRLGVNVFWRAKFLHSSLNCLSEQLCLWVIDWKTQ